MISKEKLNRINQLSKKAKTEGLTNEEAAEQKMLRDEYIKNFRKQFKDTLHGVTVVDVEGNDVTPEKLRVSKQQRNNPRLH